MPSLIRLVFPPIEKSWNLHTLRRYRYREFSFAEQVKRLEVEFTQELSKHDDDDDKDDDDDDDATDHQCFSSNSIDSSVELLGYSSKLFNDIRDHLLRVMRPAELCFFSLLGEVGTGRTIVANILFDDLRNQKTQEDWMFDCIAWVKVGAECELNKVMIRILAQVDNLAAGELYEGMNDEKMVCKQLNKVLKHRRYMIVLDDVHDVQLIKHLKSSCPNQSNGSLVLFTTSSDEISQLADLPITFKRPRRFFEENMWFVLRGVCFHNESISAELEEAGIKIVQNCQSLAISVAKAFVFLLTAERTVEPWSKLADSACRY